MATEEQKKAEQTTEQVEETTDQAQTAEAAEATEATEEAEAADSTDSEAAKLQAQYDEMKDKYVRLNAEYENFRRRSAKEKMDILTNARCEIVKDMLPVIDDFERAMVHIGEAKDVDALREGVELIFRKFTDFLNRTGIETLDPKGEVFDAEKHEAIAKMPAPQEGDKGKIFDCVEKGYKLNEKFIRYPKVVVSE